MALAGCAALVACGGALSPTDASTADRSDAGPRANDAAPFDADATAPDATEPDTAPDDATVDADDAPTPRDATVDAGPPLPTPIRYVIVIVKENHTFDNYFYDFPGVQSAPPRTVRLSTGATLDLTTQIAPFAVFPHNDDLNHSNARAVRAWHGGAMDRFDQDADGTIQRSHGAYYHYPESQIPNYWAYARNFVLCDNFFSTTMAPSAPGHLSIVASHSIAYGNEDCPTGAHCTAVACDPANEAVMPLYNPTTCATRTGSPCFNQQTVMDNLPAGISWRVYGPTPLDHFRSIYTSHALDSTVHSRRLELVTTDLRRGDQANLTVLDISGAPGGASEHPADHPCAGENLSVNIVNAAMQGPHWNETAIVITYDDWGGWYDHVAPRVDACPAPNAGNAFNTGFRLPALIISPYARRGAGGSGLVFHGRAEQASVTRLVAELLRDPAQPPRFLEDRDANARDRSAGSLLGAFDFTQAPRPPLIRAPRTDCPAPAP